MVCVTTSYSAALSLHTCEVGTVAGCPLAGVSQFLSHRAVLGLLLQGLDEALGIAPGSAACKASTLPPVPSPQPQHSHTGRGDGAGHYGVTSCLMRSTLTPTRVLSCKSIGGTLPPTGPQTWLPL